MEKIGPFGIKFKPMEKDDWDAYAGAAPGTMIAENEDRIILWNPENNQIEEMKTAPETENGFTSMLWTAQQIV